MNRRTIIPCAIDFSQPPLPLSVSHPCIVLLLLLLLLSVSHPFIVCNVVFVADCKSPMHVEALDLIALSSEAQSAAVEKKKASPPAATGWKARGAPTPPPLPHPSAHPSSVGMFTSYLQPLQGRGHWMSLATWPGDGCHDQQSSALDFQTPHPI
jgi:hypothetical protein